MSPTFSPTLLQNHIKISNEYVKIWIEDLKSQGDESVHNLTPLCAKLALEIICGNTTNIEAYNVLLAK